MRSFGLEKFIAHIVGPSSSNHQKLYLPIFFSRSLSIERNLSINVLCSKRELLDRTLIALGTTSQRRVDQPSPFEGHGEGQFSTIKHVNLPKQAHLYFSFLSIRWSASSFIFQPAESFAQSWRDFFGDSFHNSLLGFEQKKASNTQWGKAKTIANEANFFNYEFAKYTTSLESAAVFF